MNTRPIEDVYPLSPMQQGMLFHSLYAPYSGVYIEQMSCELHGPLQSAAFARAWQQVLARHAILRTAFVWEDVDEPLQVVYREVELPLEQHDWRALTPDQQATQLDVLLQHARHTGFDLADAPLMRLDLIQTAADTHQFVWTHHHLLLDGWSLPLLLQEVFVLYSTFAEGRQAQLPTPRPYRDYIAWLKQQDLAEAERFWRDMLAGFSAPTPLVVDHAAAEFAAHGATSGRHTSLLPAATTATLQTLAQQRQITLTTLVQGAWALLLSRYSGERDVIFGVTVAGRPPELIGSETMVGLFINTLPLQVAVTPDTRLDEWLTALHLQQAAIRQYEWSPLVEIQGWSSVPRDQPLFESIVVVENYPVDAALREQQHALRIEQVRSFERTNYPLLLEAAPGRELGLTINYDPQRFDAVTIERLLAHLETLLRNMATSPDRRLREIGLLSDAERAQILREWNNTARPMPEQCVQQLVEAQAARTPNAVAVELDGARLSYAELNRRANQVAHHLRARGIGPNELVGVCMTRSTEMIVAVLGVLKAGAAYVPLDPSYPTARLQFMLDDAQIALVLTHEAAATLNALAQPPHAPRLVALDADWSTIAQQPTANPAIVATPDDLAYVIYTSGSTGQPKGVLLQHRGLLNLVLGQIEMFAISAESRLLQFASLSFDASVSEIFTALVSGATLVLTDRTTLASIEKLTALIRQQAVSVVTLPPALLALLSPAELTSLRTVVSAGERCPVEVAARWSEFARDADRRFINAYGPTEATIGPCAYLVEHVPQRAQTIPIGRPLPNVELYVLDREMQPVPVGVPGEIHIGGPGVARGYLNRPALTAERFIPNPTDPASTGRLYCTGDLGRYRADGHLEYLGRVDQQIKLRGFRIEPGEIEAALRQHPAVRDVAVVARTDNPGQTALVAYVVEEPRTGGGEPRTKNHEPGSGEEGTREQGNKGCGEPRTGALWANQELRADDLMLSATELRAFLQTRLPDYMIPAAFVVLDALPLNANGKLDRAALPAPDTQCAAETSGVALPRTPEAELLIGIWAHVLGRERIGIRDNFFELGGHSLLATQALSRIRDAFGVELPLRTLFESPTIHGLAQQIAALRQQQTALVMPPLERVAPDQPLPLSFAQQRLWFLDQLQPNSALYNNPTALRLTGELDTAVLQRSISEIIRRHDVLRTTFVTSADQPVQVIAPVESYDAITLPVIDLEALPAAEQAETVQRLATEDARTPFDLERGPLLRISLLRLAPADHVALVTIHHIVSDGWSIKVMLSEVATLYQAFASGQESPLLPLPVQYADYAVWQRRWIEGAVLETQLAYWKEQLGPEGTHAPPLLELPTDRPRPAMQSFHGATRSFTLPEDVSAAAIALSRSENVTPFMTLLAAFQIVLARYSGQDDIAVGTPIANRTRPELEALIGCFVNTLVLRTDLSDDPSFRDVLIQVRDVTLNAYAHQDVPFEMVVEALQPQRNLSHAPFFQVMFVLDNAPASAYQLPGLSMAALAAESGTSRFDVTIMLGEDAHGFNGAVEYNTDLFDAATIDRLLSHFTTLLASAIDDPDQPIAALPLLTERERQQLLIDWNETTTAVPALGTFHALVAAQTARTPDAVAAIFDQRTLTYRELDARANQLAQQLHTLGVGPDTIVGLCLDRSLDLVIAMLGVLKAGGAFLPLDPSYPAARLAFMLDDAHAPVLITHESLRALLPHYSGRRVLLDTDAQEIAQRPATPPAVAVTPDNLAYVIYTSGSTGQPKGTLLRHRGLCNLSAAQAQQFTLGPGDRVLQFAALSFDAAVWEVSMALTSGAALVLGRPAQLAAGPALLSFLRDSAITTATLPPSLLAVLEPAELPALRTVIAAGEACSQEIVRQWAPGRRFVNAYGPTETTVCATWAVCDANDPLPPSIGRALPNFKLYVLDREMQPVPVGVPGELYIGGPGVARGYLNRPELTAERFIDPATMSGLAAAERPSNTRLYKTGDLVRYRADGQLEFLGRIDQQVKLRGFRIELGEIEAALRQHPAVQDSLVVAQSVAAGDTRLIGYIVADADNAPSTSALQQFVQQSLPAYMVPATIVRLERWPMTPANKLDRAALPMPDGARPDLERAYVAPRTPTERTLAELCGTLLGVTEVGVEDNFFELGGHSLLATQLLARVRDAFATDVPLRAIFEQPTIAALASTIEQLKSEGSRSDEPALVSLGREGRRMRRSAIQPDRQPTNGSAADAINTAPAGLEDVEATQ